MMTFQARMAKIWNAVTCHRFADSWQSRAAFSGEENTARFDGDKSPAESGENSPHSTSLRLRRKPRWVIRIAPRKNPARLRRFRVLIGPRPSACGCAAARKAALRLVAAPPR